jgi:hypothetical protein
LQPGFFLRTAANRCALLRNRALARAEGDRDMAARTLSQFTITPDGNGDYTLSLEDEDGETLDFTASFDQLDLITEAIDEVLDSDEDEALGVDDDEGEGKEE